MKIFIPTKHESPDATVDSTFGRCQYLLFADTENGKTYQYENTYRNENSGAGTQVAQAVIAEGAEVVLSKEIGPKAQDVLQGANVKAYYVDNVLVSEALELFKKGDLKSL